MSRIAFTKGHGTGNDFVVLLDESDELRLNESQIASLCHRHLGLGADGILRAVRESLWFMDYRNADGSIAEMCGNGIRVFAEFLYQRDLISNIADLDTRAGVKHVERVAEKVWSVDMGEVTLTSETTHVSYRNAEYHATPARVGNPHLVIHLESLQQLPTELNWDEVAEVLSEPNGFNLEFYEVISPTEVSMRVLERGVGETLSCGTGVCAVAQVHMRNSGSMSCVVHVPGGSLSVDQTPHGVRLTGPVELIADGFVEVP